MNPTIARRPVAQRLREWLIARCLAPINLDGSQVSEVTIDGQSVSAVTMDGDQVFGSAIPDSGGTHQWNWSAGSGTLVSDVIGSLDADFTGITWQTGAGAGDVYGVLDGTDDRASLGTSNLTHFLTAGEGTIFQWARPDDQDRNFVFSTENVSTDSNGIAFEADTLNDQYFARLNIAGNSASISGGSPQTHVGSWIAMALVANGTELIFYVAEPTNYSMAEIGRSSLPATATGDYSTDLDYGRSEANGNFEGGMDYGFTDSVGRSQSNLQSIVDDTKGYYQ